MTEITHLPSPFCILLVEDSEHDFLAFKRSFKKSQVDCKITRYEKAEEALVSLASDYSQYDLIVTDHKLPGMTGLEFRNELFARNIPLPVVLMTGAGSESLAARSLKAGMADYLIKDLIQTNRDILPALLFDVWQKNYDRQARVCAEKALHESEERFKAISLSIADWVWETDQDGKYTFASGKVEEMLGYTSVELIGKTPFHFMPVEEAEQAITIFKDILSARKPIVDIENWNLSKNGARKCLLTNGFPIFTEEGVWVGYRGVHKDITRRKQTEEELQRSSQVERVFNELLHLSLVDISLPEIYFQFIHYLISLPWMSVESKGAVFIMSEDQKYLEMKAEFGLHHSLRSKCEHVPLGKCLCGRAALSGEIVFADCIDDRHDIRYEAMPPHGHYCVPILSAENAVLGVFTLYTVERTHKDERTEEILIAVSRLLAAIIKRKQAEHALQMTNAELDNRVEEQTAELLKTNAELKNEIMERVRLEKERQDIQNKVMIQDKLATLGQVATGVAHELNQPLTYITTIIQTTIEKLQNNKIDPEKLIKKFEKAAHQAARILEITTHLRTVGRSDDAKRQEVDLSAILDDSLVLMNEKMKLRNITLKTDIPDTMPVVLGIHNKLEQVFINLTTNAIDALEKEGGGEINVEMLQEGDSLVVRYSDNGCGMPPEVLDKIFEPFYTTKERGKGTGLGMAIINDIIVDHNGTITCTSEQGKGTIFTITLPVNKDDSL